MASDTAPEFLICPITFELFTDPVMADDGHTYERTAIIQWIQQSGGISPLTRERITVNGLRPNRNVKSAVDAFKKCSRERQYKFELNVDIRKRDLKMQSFGKKLYNAEWIPEKRGPPIVLLQIDGARAMREAKFYVELIHPNIVRTYGLVKTPQEIVILVQERAAGDLHQYLFDAPRQPLEAVLCKMFVQIASAMCYLTYRNIVHGDLACRNVLVFKYHETDVKQNVVKLADFGLSRYRSLYSTVSSTASTNIIPIRYAAPEVLENNRPDEKSDIFSMGILMWEAYEKGQIPWSQFHDDNEVRQLVIGGARLTQPRTCASDVMWRLIEQCWMIEKHNRPSFTDLQEKLQIMNCPAHPLSPSFINTRDLSLGVSPRTVKPSAPPAPPPLSSCIRIVWEQCRIYVATHKWKIFILLLILLGLIISLSVVFGRKSSGREKPTETTIISTTTTTTPPHTILTNVIDPIFGIWKTVPGGSSTASISSSGGGPGNYVPNQHPGLILDNDTLTKYFNHGNGDWTVYSSTKGVETGFYITPVVGLSILREFRVATAEDRPLRDPLSVTIECSNSTGSSLTYGFSWILIYSGPTGLLSDPGRTQFGTRQLLNNNKACTSYRVLVSSQRGSDNAVQYSEFHLFGWY